MLCFSCLFFSKAALESESSLQRLCVLICADKAGAWARTRVERDSEAEAEARGARRAHSEQLRVMSNLYTCIAHLKQDRAFIDSL